MALASRGSAPASATAGFTYVGLLIAVAIAGTVLAAAGTLWSAEAQRSREAQLLFAGREIRTALERYRAVHAGTAQPLPGSLEELLEDRRGPAVRRHLRRLYPDPMTRDGTWVLVRDGAGRIAGVHSRSSAAPRKRAGFLPGEEAFAAAATYADWRFLVGPLAAPAAPGRGGE